MRRYRALRRETDGWTLVDTEDDAYQAVRGVAVDGGLRPGHLVAADPGAVDAGELDEFETVETTLFAFADGVTGLFEEAIDVWREAQREGSGVNSRVTFDTSREPNGALYAFADPPGADVFREFQDGQRPLEPLLERVSAGPPHELFVFRPAGHEFVLVYIVLQKGSVLADTVRDTYGCPRAP
jgi:hypothetical protein